MYANAVNDDPIIFKSLAELAVKYKQDKEHNGLVVGFGCYGDGTVLCCFYF